MKMMLSTLAFAVLVSGVFSKALAADAPAHDGASGAAQGHESDAHGGGHAPIGAPHHDEHSGGTHHDTIGVKQPVAEPAKATRPGRVTLAEPKALSKLKKGAITLKWNPVEGAESYTVQVATDPRYKWFVANEQFVKGESFQTPDLAPGMYYWRVAAKKPGNDAGWTTGFFTPSSFETQE